jgi:hypothetical protein
MNSLSPQEVARLRRSSLYAAVATAAGAALLVGALVYGMWELHSVGEQVQKKQEELTVAEDLRNQAEAKRKEADQQREEAEKQLRRKQEELKGATDLLRYNHPIDYTDVKDLAVRNGPAFPVLERVLNLGQRNVKYKVGGRSPEEGFDSVTFADYILRSTLPRERLSSPGAVAWAAFKKVDRPQVGDLAFYPPGYSMFYFKDHKGNPFVIGMTPFGVASLNPDFAPSEGYRHVPFAGE